jgi:hypothetical protein
MSLFRLQERIMTKNHDNSPVAVSEWQSEPELKYVRLMPWCQWHNALRGARRINDFAIGGLPIAALISQVEFIKILPGHFDPDVIAQAGSSKSNTKVERRWPEDVQQAKRWQQSSEFRWLNVPTARKSAVDALGMPVTKQFPLFRDDELGSDCFILRTQDTSPHGRIT